MNNKKEKKAKENKKTSKMNNSSKVVKTPNEVKVIKDKKPNKFLEFISKKWLVNGITTLLLVAIIVGIYFGVEFLLVKAKLPEFDMTKEKLYSLSEETNTKVGSIDKDIKITLINYGNNDAIKNVVTRYEKLNKKITSENIDKLESRADLMQKYSLSSTDNLLVVSCGDKEAKLTESDLYTADYQTGKTMDISEEAITNAIIDVTSDTKPKVYFMSNHARYSIQYYSTLMTTLKKDANDVEKLDLLTTGKVPEDCKCLVIPSLGEDLTEPEKNYIVSYINNGGNLLLLCGANLDEVKLDNLQQVLDLYGLSLSNGVLLEGKADNMISGAPNIVVEDVQSSSITKNMNMNLKACFPNATAINKVNDSEKLEQLGVKYETLITSSEKSFIRKDLKTATLNRVDSDSEVKSYDLGVLATKNINENKSSKLILYSNEAYDQISLGNYPIKAYNNEDIVANSISYLNEKDNTITIRKNYENVTYNVTQQQNTIIMAIIFISPAVIVIAGIIVWQIRRRKNK